MSYDLFSADKVTAIEYLRRLSAAVDNIIAEMQPNEFPGAINWGDLGCREALFGIDADGDIHYRVLIEEAAPGEEAFCRYIETQLVARDWPDISVSTEW